MWWIFNFEIYYRELEKVLEFKGFNDFIVIFLFYCGKIKLLKDDEDDDGIVGEFKVWRYCVF